VEVVEPGGPFNLVPGENRLPFVLRVKKEGDHGQFSSRLTLQRFDLEDVPNIGTVSVAYGIEKPSYTSEIVILLVALGSLAAAVLRFRRQRYLFGVLEIVTGSGGAAPGRIDLSSLKRTKARLAELVGLASAEGDVELSVGRHENGERVVRLSNAKGSVLLNERRLEEGFVEEIFNGDRLTLGDRKIRYSGPERPDPSEELRLRTGNSL
jgi:hypothetical protein